MRQPIHNTAKLPRQLLDELGVSGIGQYSGQRRGNGLQNRKEQRKTARVQRKSSHTTSSKGRLQISRQGLSLETVRETQNHPSVAPSPKVKAISAQAKAPKSILKVTAPKEGLNSATSPSSEPSVNISRGLKDRLAADDAEIAALEKKLGIQNSTKLPRSFEEDGLDSLLEGIDDAVGLNELGSKKRKRAEADEWLESKRAKAQAPEEVDEASSGGFSEEEDSGTDLQDVGFGREGGDLVDQLSIDEQYDSNAFVEEGDELDGQLDSDVDDDVDSLDKGKERSPQKNSVKKERENPYVAPAVGDNITNQRKYIPPSLRDRGITESKDLLQLRRQIQGLLNRLSEANLVSILGDVEKLYRDHPRQHVSTTLLDLLMGLLSDPTVLQDTFIILHAGFIAAIYKVSGTDFGAQALQRIDEEFALRYTDIDHESSGKETINLISLLTELYNFQVISSNLIYDFIRIFLDNLSENTTELLLKVIRNAGPQLRQDDPSALKEIVLQLQTAVNRVGEDNISMRTKFMVESMNRLKNNRMKNGIAASTITSEHIIRMKKALGTLNQRSIRATEPLRVGLNDLRDNEKRGKWWLVGASYKDNKKAEAQSEIQLRTTSTSNKSVEDMDSVTADLVQLAKEQRMNTDVRRSIFIAIMSSTDVNDAYVRLMKLNLKKSQELEIPKLLIQCAGAEKVYNPFYTILSRRVCSDKKLKMAFQFSLWDLFKRMGEGEDGAEEREDAEGEGELGLRGLVNLARMFGTLIAEGGLSLAVLKVFAFAFTILFTFWVINTV